MREALKFCCEHSALGIDKHRREFLADLSEWQLEGEENGP